MQKKNGSNLTRKILVHNLDISLPIDTNAAMKVLGDNNSLFHKMLARLESLSIKTCMSEIKDALQTENWAKMYTSSASLRGPCGYVGAGRIQYACYYIETAYKNSDFVAMESYYPLLVEVIIEFKRYSRKYLAESQGKKASYI